MKLIKKICALTLVAAASTSLASCGSGTSSDEVTIIWWNNYQVPSTSLSEEEARASSTYREYYYALDLISEFEEANPGIKVETSYQGSYSDIVTQVKSGLSTGDLPTMASTYGDAVATYNAAGATYDMSDYAKETLETDTDFNQNYLSIEKGMYGGKYLTLPYSKSSECLAVNQSVFDKVGAGETGTTTDSYTAPVAASTKTAYSVPTNWNELITTARQMKVDYPEVFANQKDSDGYFTAVPFCWDSTENMFISLLENAGIDYTDGTGSTELTRILFNSDEAKELMTQIKAWNIEGLICTQNQLPVSTSGYHEYSSNMLVSGKIFMCISSTAGARYFATTGGFEASINHVPAWGDGELSDAKVVSQGPSLTFFQNRDSAVNEAAKKFYTYLTNTTNSATLAVNTAYFPLRTSSYETDSVKNLLTAANTGVDASATYAEKNSAYTGMALQLNETYSNENAYFLSDVFTESGDTRTAVGNLLNAILDDDSVTDSTDTTAIRAVVDTAFTNAYNSLMA